MKPRETIAQFDSFLAEHGLSFEAIVIGGTALGLLGVVSRQTRDCDILHPELPPAVHDAARAFAASRRSAGDPLSDDWLNNGPSTLGRALPAGWQDRTQPAFKGRALVLRCLGREDLLRSKLFALCDRGLDLEDCAALAPSAVEIEQIAPWLEGQDANPDWPAHVRATLADLGRRLGHGA
jgi:hypothetical protein